MSAEAVKKRGRPKKVISDPIEIDLLETRKSATRAKSTKAAPKPVKATPAATKKTTSDPTKSKAAATASPVSKTTSKPALTPSSSTKTESKPPTPTPSKTTTKPLVTPKNSKILKKVRELSSKSVPDPPDPVLSSIPSPTTISTKSAVQNSLPKTPSPSTPEKPIPAPISSRIPPGAANSPPKIPIAALNSEIVSNISSRAGARPNTGSHGQLPPNYRSVARRITSAIVAMPIVIVMSYVLYERLVLGEDQKMRVKPGLTKIELPNVDAPGEDVNGES